MLGALAGRAVDRVPLDLAGFQFALREAIEKEADPFRRDVARRVFEETAFRHDVNSFVNRFLVTPPQRMRTEERELANGNTEATGVIDTPKGELTFVTAWDPKARTDWMVKYPVESREEALKLASVTWELPEGLAPPDADLYPPGLAERGLVTTSISSPMVCVSGCMPYEMFLELCFTDLPLVEELTEICRRRVLECVEVLLSGPGIDIVWMGGSEWVTPPMASPAVYDALVQEQERSIIDHVHANSRALVHIHCHGRVREALPGMIDRGGDYTEPVEPPPDGDITMLEAKDIAGGRITLGGNVECRILCNEPEEAVEAATRAAFEGGLERFVLRATEGPSPEISEREFRNWMRMVDVWEELSVR